MKKFMDEDFLLSTEAARVLFHEYAENMPIIDYHCHIAPMELAGKIHYKTITELWLAGDHYKWRLMRANGIDEKFITGKASEYEKFLAYATALEGAVGNPLYHWSHLELQRYFGIDEELNSESAERIYNRCNEILASGALNVESIIRQSKVLCVGTTDDPIDDLSEHGKITVTKAIPTFRPDKLFTTNGQAFKQYTDELEKAAGRPINCYIQLCEALMNRMNYFDEMGCRSSDHGMEEIKCVKADPFEVEDIFKRLRSGEDVSSEDGDKMLSALMLFLGEEYAKRGWVMQLHFGVVRNTNTKMFEKVGKDTGFDRIRGGVSVAGLAKLLDDLDSRNVLPKTILYSLDPNDNAVLDVLAGCFSETGVKGKVQHGAAWWFNDHLPGMRAHLEDLASRGLLASFVGILTDSRSMLSYTRHEYFRRILCDFIGSKVENGEFAWDEKRLGKMVQDISYNNAREFFGLELL